MDRVGAPFDRSFGELSETAVSSALEQSERAHQRRPPAALGLILDDQRTVRVTIEIAVTPTGAEDSALPDGHYRAR